MLQFSSHVFFKITAFYVGTVWESGFTIEPHFLCLLFSVRCLFQFGGVVSTADVGERCIWSKNPFFVFLFFAFLPFGYLFYRTFKQEEVLHQRTVVTENWRRESFWLYCCVKIILESLRRCSNACIIRCLSFQPLFIFPLHI